MFRPHPPDSSQADTRATHITTVRRIVATKCPRYPLALMFFVRSHSCQSRLPPLHAAAQQGYNRQCGRVQCPLKCQTHAQLIQCRPPVSNRSSVVTAYSTSGRSLLAVAVLVFSSRKKQKPNARRRCLMS